jgi:hypothetical protein
MKGLAARLRADGATAFFMPHAFDPRILEHPPTSEARVEFSFFGNVHFGAHWHDARSAVLEALIEHCGLAIYSSSASQVTTGPGRYLKLSAAHWSGRLLHYMPGVFAALPFSVSLRRAAEWPSPPRWAHGARLATASRPPVFGLAMYRELAATL